MRAWLRLSSVRSLFIPFKLAGRDTMPRSFSNLKPPLLTDCLNLAQFLPFLLCGLNLLLK
jgi:hypothetical protein